MWALLALFFLGCVLHAEKALDTSLIHHAKPSHTTKKIPRQNQKITKSVKKPNKQNFQQQVKQNKEHNNANLEPLHLWIYSTVFLIAYFKDGHYKQGYGLLLQNGHVLTSSELAYDKGMYATTFVAKMQDDSGPMLICVARLRLKAIDRNRGLSLLNTHAFTNDYCQIRPESYYHARIYTKYGQDLLTKNSNPRKALQIYYPKISDQGTFEVGTFEVRTYKNILEKSHKDINYSSQYLNYSDLHRIIRPLLKDVYGRPLFNHQDEFIGMAVSLPSQNNVFATKRVIQDFLLDLKHRSIF
ncbi:hypothetical protein [Helicobacter suis]|uniref:hypothetical protein n=1 Tax=Helicobacter suis TaxID=104628 RepID=UPI001F081590|nr:hypothetical protein [Helicobacter suis]